MKPPPLLKRKATKKREDVVAMTKVKRLPKK
jgi:hypothetical protein